jgi:hypothetical protein
MVTLVTAAQVKTRLFELKGVPADRRPAGLTDAVILEYVQRLSAEIMNRLATSTAPDAGTLKRDALDGLCLDLVVIAVKRDYFGLDQATMQTLNTQETNAWRRVDAMKESPEYGTGSVAFRIAGPRGLR